MTKTKVKASRFAKMRNFGEAYESVAYGFFELPKAKKENDEIVIQEKILVRILKGQTKIEFHIDPEQEIDIAIFENSSAKEPYASEYKLKQKLEEAKLEADLYSTSEDGVDAFKTFPRFKEDPMWEKADKHWKMLDEIDEIQNEFFNFQKEQSKSIPMEYHQAAFEVKQMIVQKIKEMGFEGWREKEKFMKALQYQGVQMNDIYERNWCSSSAECNHVMHPHEDITDKLK